MQRYKIFLICNSFNKKIKLFFNSVYLWVVFTYYEYSIYILCNSVFCSVIRL